MVPPWTTTCSIVEDQTTAEKGGTNIALLNAGSVIGPLLGLFGGAVCLSVWTDVSNRDQITITPENANWIGAWWLPMFVGWVLRFLTCLFFGYGDFRKK